MATTTLPGFTIAYEDVGSGPVLVLLHAFPLEREFWQPQLDGLKDVVRVVAPDLRGFGGTDGFTGTPSVEQLADDVASLLDALSITEPVVVGGLSMGGYVALALARKYPERLRGLILADTQAAPDSAEGKVTRNKLIAFVEKTSAAELIEQMLPKLVNESTRRQRPEVVEEVRRLAGRQSIPGVSAALKALRDRPDATPGLSSITVPTLVLVGSDDVITPAAVAEAMAAAIPKSQCVILADAGHLSNLEQPGAFTTAVREFMLQLP